MTDSQTLLRQLKKNLNLLEERKAKYGRDVPLALVNQIEDHEKAIMLTQQAKDGALTEAEWREALKPLLLAVNEGRVVNIDQQNQTVAGSQYNAGHDVVIYNYHYHGQAEVEPPPATDVTDEPLPANPYRGLFTFRPEHAPFFFGRESFTRQLIAAVESRRLVTVLGASGSGKSSVVFAGLVPALVNRPGEPWRFTTFRPGDDPFQNLAVALIPLYETSLSKTALLGATRDLAESLRQGRYPLDDVLGLIHESQPDHRLLLIADQFEELYTLCRDTDTRHAFLDLLLAVFHPDQAKSKIQNPQSKIVLTLRADFLGQASLYRPWADALQGATELLGPMTEAELRQAIEKPAGVQGVTFEAGLVETLLADVGQQAGSLPLLEFALSELWQKQTQRVLTHRAYVEIGQVAGALSRHADRAYAELTPTEQEQARWIFVQLVNPGLGTEDTRRLATRHELEQNWPLVTKLADERLVVTTGSESEDGTQQNTVEVVHEALIRNWPQLRTWLDTDREFLTWRLRLREDLRRWEETELDDGALLRGAPLALAQEKMTERANDLTEPEWEYIQVSLTEKQRHESRRWWLLVGTAAAAVIMTILAAVSFFQWQDANRQRAIAEESSQTANRQRAIAEEASQAAAQRIKDLVSVYMQPKNVPSRIELFWGLPSGVQEVILQAEDDRLEQIILELMPTMADVNGSGVTDPLLVAMLEGAKANNSNNTLIDGLTYWQTARTSVRLLEYQQALESYNHAIQTISSNPALYYDRARVYVALKNYKAALADLEHVMIITFPDKDKEEKDNLGLPQKRLPADFASDGQIEQAVRQIIIAYPELTTEYKANRSNYSALPEVRLPKTIIDSQGISMVQVPSGPFKMGSNDGDSDEQPVHEVYLDEYYIDQYEVTNTHYQDCVKSGVCDPSNCSGLYQGEWTNHPVVCVNWFQARTYCEVWRDGGLPTEAQWEKAARGNDERTYPWGEEITVHLLNFGGNEDGTMEIGRYPEGISPYKVYDMAGNVWEWVQSEYRDYPYQADDGRENLNGTNVRVLRGGSWYYFDDTARTSNRDVGLTPFIQSVNIGFRCVR